MNGYWLEEFPVINEYDLEVEETVYELELESTGGTSIDIEEI